MTESLPARISKIEQALAAVETPDQAKQVIAIADAAIAYAKSLGREFVDARRKAEALKLDAERRLGEFLRTMPKALGGRPEKTGTKSEPVFRRPNLGGTKSGPPKSSAPTLADLGIDKKTSARVQKLAELPAETVEAIKAGELSVNQAIAPKPAAPRASKTDTLQARVSELQAENAVLVERIAEVAQDAEEAIADNASMAAAFESDDKLAPLLAENKRLRAEIVIARQRINGLMNEKNEAVRAAKSWQRKYEKLKGGA